ncbi:unnamed protein product, partial [Brassica rapa subsp. trilocularis]
KLFTSRKRKKQKQKAIHRLLLQNPPHHHFLFLFSSSETEMEDFRSRSYGEGRISDRSSDGPGSLSVNGGNSSMQDFRSYSISYTDYPTRISQDNPNRKKERSSSSWGFVDPDLQRKKRVVSYRVYTAEGKLKGSLRKSFKWIKDKCNKILN